MKKTTILLVDDHPLIREGIRKLIESKPEYEIIGEASSGLEACNIANSLRPDVVLMDIAIGGMNGIQAGKKILEFHPECKIIILSMYATKEYVLAANRYGMSGYVQKVSAGDELLLAIETVAAGNKYFSPYVYETLSEYVLSSATSEDPFDLLSPRENELLKLLISGHSNKQIAKKMDIALGTVYTYRNRIREKLGVEDDIQLVISALSSKQFNMEGA